MDGAMLLSEKGIFRFLLAFSVILMITGSAVLFFLTHDDLTTEKISLAGPDGVIPAILVQPKEGGPFPAVVLLHGYGSRKELILPTALEIGKAGFCVLIPDLRGHGDSQLPSDFGGMERFDIIRVIDYLVSRADVDSTKIALMGSSFGAMNAIIAGGIDNRIMTVVSSSSPANLSRWLRDKDWDGEERHSFIQHVPIEFDSREKQNWRSPVAYVDKIPSVLIFHGDTDEIVPVSNAYELYSHASNSSRLRIIRGAEHD
ncbi:MAG: alpha/beta hydrolase, partial [Candidatus Hodarchaeales archaeon]